MMRALKGRNKKIPWDNVISFSEKERAEEDAQSV
jgi:hypothetical protein